MSGRSMEASLDRRTRIDLGLDLLALRSQPRQAHSLQEIAAWCGCSRENIRRIEQKALAKLWVRLRQIGVEMELEGNGQNRHFGKIVEHSRLLTARRERRL